MRSAERGRYLYNNIFLPTIIILLPILHSINTYSAANIILYYIQSTANPEYIADTVVIYVYLYLATFICIYNIGNGLTYEFKLLKTNFKDYFLMLKISKGNSTKNYIRPAVLRNIFYTRLCLYMSIRNFQITSFGRTRTTTNPLPPPQRTDFPVAHRKKTKPIKCCYTHALRLTHSQRRYTVYIADRRHLQPIQVYSIGIIVTIL